MKSLAFVLVLAISAGATAVRNDDYEMSDGAKCSIEGKTDKPELKKLNVLKNRSAMPTADDIDTDVTLAGLLTPGEDENRFDTARAARIVGFVNDVKVGGKETCNCKATDPVDRDTHIELSLSPDALHNQRAIAEVTPRIRKQKLPDDVDWSTMTLQSHGDNGIKGKWVEVTGWLFFDAEHTNAAENTSPGHAGNWRATCWEIHPITDIKTLDGPPPNTPIIQPHVLRAMHRAHVMHVARDKGRRDLIEARNTRNLALLAED